MIEAITDPDLTKAKPQLGRRFTLADTAALAAGVLFLVAVIALAGPVVQTGRTALPALLLLVGVAGT